MQEENDERRVAAEREAEGRDSNSSSEKNQPTRVRARMAVTGEKYLIAMRREELHDRWECPACKQEVYWVEEEKALAHDHDCFEKDIDPVRMALVEGPES